jgi:hypothetical protein
MRCAGNHVDLDAWMVAVWWSDRAGSDTKTSEVAAHVRLAQIAVDALRRPDRKPSSVQPKSAVVRRAGEDDRGRYPCGTGGMLAMSIAFSDRTESQ